MTQVRTVLLIGLILAGIGVWSYNGLLVVDRLGLAAHLTGAGAPPSGSQRLALPALPDTGRTAYDGAFRDPFEPDFRLPPPLRVPPKPAPGRQAVAVPPPQLVLEGIVWDPAAPIAMIKGPDGRSEPLRVGMTVAGATITRIDRATVVLRFGTHTLTLETPGPRL